MPWELQGRIGELRQRNTKVRIYMARRALSTEQCLRVESGQPWVQNWASPLLTCCVTMGKLLNLSEPKFLIYKKGRKYLCHSCESRWDTRTLISCPPPPSHLFSEWTNEVLPDRQQAVSAHCAYCRPDSCPICAHPAQGLDLPVSGRPVYVFRAFAESCEIQAPAQVSALGCLLISALLLPCRPSLGFGPGSPFRSQPAIFWNEQRGSWPTPVSVSVSLFLSPHLPPLFWLRNVSPACQQQWEVT